MEKIFRIKHYNDRTVLFNEKGINDLKRGDIFYKMEDFQSVTLFDLDKNYIHQILHKLDEGVDYDFERLINKEL